MQTVRACSERCSCFCRPSAFTYEDQKAAQEDFLQDFNSQILTAFSQLLVNLFRSV